MRMKLWCSIAGLVIWPRRCVLELRGNHLAGSDCGLVATHTRLREFLEYFQCFIDSFSMRNSDSFIVSNERRKRYLLRRAERSVPARTMFGRSDFFAVVVVSLSGFDGSNELFTRMWVLTGA